MIERRFTVLWEKVGDGPKKIVGYTQRISYSSESDKLFNDIEFWKNAVQDWKGFPVKRFTTSEGFIYDISEVKGIDQDG